MKRPLDACLFAADHHAAQRRKGAAAEPYVNHVIEVAARVAASPAADENTVIAALLHDIVEDTDGTEAEIRAAFGDKVAALVMEVTDDKTLPKAERKRRQEASAAGKSAAAKRIKLADKAANLRAMTDSPPAHWDTVRRRDYLAWARRVIAGARGVDAVLEAAFDAEAARAAAALDRALP